MFVSLGVVAWIVLAFSLVLSAILSFSMREVDKAYWPKPTTPLIAAMEYVIYFACFEYLLLTFLGPLLHGFQL